MKVLVLGASGLVGREICRLLEKENILFLGTYHSHKVDNSVFLDGSDSVQCMNLFQQYQPNICILSVVKRYTDVCEKNWNETKQINIDFVDQVSKLCQSQNVILIHLSTDYVFDGKNPPFLPDSETNPLQNYGISKLMAEKRIIANTNHYIIIRVPVLYSQNVLQLEESAITVIGKNVLNQIQPTQEDNYSIRRPLFIQDLTFFLLKIIRNVDTYQGIYHFFNPYDKITKYEMAKLIGEYLHKSTEHITPIYHEPNDGANRPYDTQLLDDRIHFGVNCVINKVVATVGSSHITRISQGISLCFEKLYHPKLYNNPLLPVDDILLLLDLDGTILNSDVNHINAYNKSLKYFHIPLQLTEEMLRNTSTDFFFKQQNINEKTITKIKKKKTEFLLSDPNEIYFMEGAEKMIDWIHKNNISHCVVTNTSLTVINHFKSKCSSLNHLKHWITREDYKNPKPHSDGYQLAVQRYGKNKKYLIGFENTWNGFRALQPITSIIYLFCNNLHAVNDFRKEDVYLINHFNDL